MACGENMASAPIKYKTKYLDDAAEWFKLAMDPKYAIRAVFPILENEQMMVVYNYQDDYKDDAKCAPHVSVMIAAWTTWLARKKLFVELLHPLKERVCYMDTDSIIFTTKPGEPSVPTGAFFGDLTDEIPQGLTITEFMSAGPKNYGYRLNNGDAHMSKCEVFLKRCEPASDST